MISGGRFSLIISVIAIAFFYMYMPLSARTTPAVTSDLSRDTLALHNYLTNTVRVTLAEDWPEMSFCVFPETPDLREAFTLLAALPGTRFGKTPEGESFREFEMRYVLRARYAGQARLGNAEIYLVDGETFFTNRLTIPDAVVLIEERGSYGALLYIFMALGLSVLGALAVYYFRYKAKRRE